MLTFNQIYFIYSIYINSTANLGFILYANDGSVFSSSTLSSNVSTISVVYAISSFKIYALAYGQVSICEI